MIKPSDCDKIAEALENLTMALVVIIALQIGTILIIIVTS